MIPTLGLKTSGERSFKNSPECSARCVNFTPVKLGLRSLMKKSVNGGNNTRKTRDMKRTRLKRKKPMRRVSVKQTGRLARYYPIRAQWLKENPNCAICTHPATEIHHKKYRHGSLLFDTRWFMSICRRCHRLVHGHIAWSKKFGYILSR